MSPIPSRTWTARIAGRLRAAALVALLLTHTPSALAQSPAAMATAAPITLAQPEPPARTLPAAAGVTASKTDAPLGDTNRNGRSDPGETLRYTVVVSNSSGADLAGVTFDDTLDPNTSLVAGSLRISPLAFGDSYSTIRDTPLAVGAPGLLSNDTGTPAPAITPRSVTTAAGGTATISADGSFSYTPPPGYTGIDSFGYSATNSAGSDTGVATLAVRAVPVAVDDTYTVARDTSRTVLAPGVLANDTGFPPPSVTPFSGPTTAGGSVTIAGNGGFSYSAPAGYTGDDTFAYTAINAAGSDTGTVTMTVGVAPLAQNDAGYVTPRDTPLSVASGTGLLVNDTLGSPAATVLSFGGGALPGTAASNSAGASVGFGSGGTLTVNADGSFDFRPSAGFAGLFSFGYRIGNLFGTSDAVATISVQQIPAITSTNAVTFTVGVAGNFSVTSTGFPTPTLAIGGDALPSGVTFADNGDGSGTLGGTPSADTAGIYNLTFTASNAAGSSSPQSFTLTVQEGPIVTSANNTTFTAGTPGSFAVTTSGFPTPTLAIGGDALPAGVTFVDNGDGTGMLAGTPGAGSGGVYDLTFTATNSAGSSTPQQFTLTVDEAPAITSTDAVTFTVGAGGNFTITATGFPTPTLARGGDALPSGVTFVNNGDGTATLSGTPASGTGGIYNLTFSASSSAGTSPIQSFRLTILEVPAITSAAAVSFQIGVAGSFTVTTSGYPTPTIELAGTLPAGVTFVDNGDGTGTLSGTPSASGSFALTFTADNGVGSFVPQNFTLVVGQAPAISSAASTNFTPGVFGSFSVTTTGFPPPAITRGGVALPAGVTFVDNGDGTGTLSGTPSVAAAGSYALTFTATNSSGSSAPQSFTLTVGTMPAITSTNAVSFTVGTLGSFSVTTSGLPAPAIARGGVALPTGITFTDNGDGTGTLSGTPAAGTAGSYAITFTASNIVGSSATQSFTLLVNQAPAITSANTTNFPIGAPSSFSVTTTGFPIPSITRGGVALPSGVTFLDNGTLSGTPGAGTVGVYAITFTAANGVAPDALQNFTLNVTCPVITVTPATGALADGLYGTAYNQAFTPSGGIGPYTFDLALGTIPGGLTLSAAGALAGTPTGATGTGNFAFTVRATDAFGCQGSTAYTLLVRPNAQPENYIGGVGNTQFVVGATAPATPHVFVAGSVLSNDTGPAALAAVVLANPTNGSVTLNPSGTFIYTPNVNFTGASDSFTYTLTDGNGATNTATVTIDLSGRVWYVNNSGANGDGRSNSPFNALNNAQAPSSNGDTIFVHSGATPGGITLKPSQTLWGQGTVYTLNSLTIAAGTKPVVGGTVVLANNVTVSSLDITTSGASAMTGSGVTGVTVQNNVALSSTGAAALSLTNSSGSLTFQSITASGGTNGISLTNVGGTLAGGVGSLSGATGATFNVSGGTLTATYSGNITQANNAALVSIAGGHTTGTITFNTGTLTATNGTGLQFDNADGTYAFNGTTTLNGGDAGIDIVNGSGGTFTFASGTTITNPSGIAYGEDTSTATVNYNGTIAKTNNANTTVDINAKTGGATTFSGAISATTSTANAIDLTNTGGTVTFRGGLVANTTSGIGFNATGAGATVNVCDDNPCNPAATGALVNSLTTTTGTALNVVSTNIGANNLEFRSVSAGTAASGPTSGIILNTTGSSGGLTVKGDGGGSNNGSGGTIQRTTGIGISLTSTSDVNLGYMNVQNSGDSGIKGISVTDFTLNRSNLTSNGNSTSDEGIQFGEFSGNTVGVTGNVSITNSDVSANAHNNLHIRNTSGTISSFTVTSSSFNNLNDTFGANAFLYEMSGTAVTTLATITSGTFQNNSPQRALEVQTHDTGAITKFTVQTSTFIDNGIQASFTQDTSSNLNFNFINNGTAAVPMTGSILQAINVFSSSQSTGGTIQGRIEGNRIGNSAVAGSGSTGGAISAVIQGQTAATLNIDGNVIRQTSGDARAIGLAFRGPANPLAGTLGPNSVVSDVTVTNNDVLPGAAPSGFPLAAIVIEADNQSGADNKSPTVRADIRGNTVPSSPVFDFFSTNIIFYEYGAANGHGIGQLVDSPPASADATAQLQSTNTGGATAANGVALIAGPINPPPLAMAPNTNQFLAQNTVETNPIARAQATSTNLKPASAFTTAFNLGSLFKHTAWAKPQGTTVKASTTLPTGNQAGSATESFAPPAAPQAGSVTANIGTIPAGKQVTILFDVLIANPLPVGVGQISNQGSVTGSGLAAVPTDDPRKPGAADPTITFLGARKIYMPLIMLGAGPPLPDLVVSSITAAGGNLQVTIRNNGQLAAVEPFWVDAYINPTSAPVRVNQLWNNVGNRGATWGVVGSVLPLEPGETLTLTVGDIYYRSALSNPGGPITAGTRLYGQVDSFNSATNYGAVLEVHERDGGAYNNILGPVAAP